MRRKSGVTSFELATVTKIHLNAVVSELNVNSFTRAGVFSVVK